MTRPSDIDLAIIGGGLVSATVALAASALRPHWQVALICAEPRCGGGPIGPTFVADLPPGGADLIGDAIVAQWPGFHAVHTDRIEDHERPLLSVAPEQLHADVALRLGPDRLLCALPSATIGHAGGVVRAGEHRFAARAVLDLRTAPRLPVAPLIHIDQGSLFDTQAGGLELPVLIDTGETADRATPGTGETPGLRQYVPAMPGWLQIRRLSFATTMEQVRFRAEAPAGGVERVHASFMPFAGNSEPVPLGPPNPLLPSALPGALELALAIVRIGIPHDEPLSQTALNAALARFAIATADRLAPRLQALHLVASAGPAAMPQAALLASRLHVTG